ncbi:Cell Wall Hydrolase [compost metagenome]
MKAVANVVMNRVNSGKYPNSVSGVVNQRKWTKSGWVCQFSYMCQLKDRSMTDEESRYKAGYVAWKATNGVLKDTTKGADHYLNKSKVKTLPTWVYAFNRTVKIGDHTFYASKDI